MEGVNGPVGPAAESSKGAETIPSSESKQVCNGE